MTKPLNDICSHNPNRLQAISRWLQRCFLLPFLLVTPPAIAESIVLQANDSAPYWSESLADGGLGVELIQAISAATGLETRIDFLPLARMIEDRNNNDLGNPEFYMTRQEYGAIIPIALTQSALFYYRPHFLQPPKLDSIEDLQRYRLGILKGALVDRHAFEQMGLQFESSYSQASLFKKLKLGRIDVVFEIDLVGQQMIAQLFPDQRGDFIRIAIDNSVSPIAIMLDADLPDVASIGNQYRKGLETIIANGRYQQIIEKYYPDHQIPTDWFTQLQRFQQLYDF